MKHQKQKQRMVKIMKRNFLSMINEVPVALHPAMNNEIYEMLKLRINKENIQEFLSSGEAEILSNVKQTNLAEKNYIVEDGVAIISIYNVLSKRADWMTKYFGGTPMDVLRNDFVSAMNNPEVKAVLFDVESPGGTVDGTKQTADLIYSYRGKKPIIAFANDLMASGAVWIGSAADYKIATSSARVGSISVLITHYDFSEADSKEGVTRTVISSGEYKAISSDEKKLSDKAREYLQGIANTYHEMFVGGLAKNLGISPDEVQSKMADGRIFIGSESVEIGLIDQIGTFEEAFEIAKQKANGFNINNNITTQEEKNMTPEEIKTKFPEAYAKIFQSGKTEAEVAAKAEAEVSVAAGLKAGDEKTLALVKAAFGDKAEKGLKAMMDSKMSAAQIEASKDILGVSASVPGNSEDNTSAEVTEQQKILAGIEAAQNTQLNAAGQAHTQGVDANAFDILVQAQKDKGLSNYKAIAAVRVCNPKAYDAWMISKQPLEAKTKDQ